MSEEQEFTFDKFMDDIVVKEEKAKKRHVQEEETPQRKYIKRYTERANNRIVVNKK
jgi:hypothetical protein